MYRPGLDDRMAPEMIARDVEVGPILNGVNDDQEGQIVSQGYLAANGCRACRGDGGDAAVQRSRCRSR